MRHLCLFTSPETWKHDSSEKKIVLCIILLDLREWELHVSPFRRGGPYLHHIIVECNVLYMV